MMWEPVSCVYVLFMFVSICIEKCLEYKSNLKGIFSVYHYYMVWMRYAAGAMFFYIINLYLAKRYCA